MTIQPAHEPRASIVDTAMCRSFSRKNAYSTGGRAQTHPEMRSEADGRAEAKGEERAVRMADCRPSSATGMASFTGLHGAVHI